MRINEKDQQIEKCEKTDLMNVQNRFFGETPIFKRSKNWKKGKTHFDEFPKYIFDETPVYIRNVIFLPKY